MADLPYIQEAQEVKITGQDNTGTTVNYVSADSNGNMLVKDYADGPVSPGTAASASSLIGGQYNTILPTLTSGQQSAIQLDSNGRLITNLTDRVVTGTLSALNATLTLPLLSDSSATIQVSGTWVGTLQVQASVDGSTYNGLVYTNGLQNAYGNPGITANGYYRIYLRGGFQSLQVFMAAYTSGTATVTIVASSAAADVGVVQLNAANLNAQVVGNVPAGGVDSGNGVKISGVYNTTLPTLTNGLRGDLQLDSSGRVIVRLLTSSDVVSAVQSGTWNLNNISGTISLPTGASTSALQTTGNTSLATIATNTTPLAQGSTTSGQVGQLEMGAVTTSAPTYTTGQTSPLSLTTSGLLRVDASGTVQPVSQSGTWTVISKTEDASGNAINSQSNALNVNTKSPRTYSAPATASVGTTSTLILAANAARKGLYLSNTTNQQISFGFDGNTAAYQYGITLYPGEKFWMDEYSYSTGAIYAITTGTAAYIGIQEIT